MNVDTKTTGTIRVWIQSETADIHFTSFILPSTDFAGATSIQTTEAQLLKNFHKSYSNRCVERGEEAFVCTLSVAITLQYDVWCSHAVYVLHQGISWNHPQGVGLSDDFRTREGVQQKGGVKTAFV